MRSFQAPRSLRLAGLCWFLSGAVLLLNIGTNTPDAATHPVPDPRSAAEVLTGPLCSALLATVACIFIYAGAWIMSGSVRMTRRELLDASASSFLFAAMNGALGVFLLLQQYQTWTFGEVVTAMGMAIGGFLYLDNRASRKDMPILHDRMRDQARL